MAAHHRSENDLINLLIEAIHNNLSDENFGAGELASAIGISQRKLGLKIKVILNKSVSQFIRETRLRKALEMLQDEDITAAEVAFKVGFGSAAYFNKCFHEFFGYPPGKIKKGDVAFSGELNTDKKFLISSRIRSFFNNNIGTLKVLSILTAVLFFGYYFTSVKNSDRNSVTGSGEQEIALAVLPFKNLADSAANQYFVDGLRDAILTNLSKIHSLRVISILSEKVLSGNNVSASALGRKLHVSYLVTGSVQKSKNSYQLRVQLTDTKKDRQLWADSFTKDIRETKDIFLIQDEIALSIVSNLNVFITQEERQLLAQTPTQNLKAWDFYQRGMYEIAKSPYGKYNDEVIKKADSLFCQALKYDSTLAEAYIGRSWIFLKKAEVKNYPKNYLDSMLALSNIALSYNNTLTDGYFTRGCYYGALQDTKQAIKEYEKAIKYNPNNYYAYHCLGYCYTDVVKSLELQLKAASLNHSSDLPTYLDEIGSIYYNAGFPEQGNLFYLKVLNITEDSVKYLGNIAETGAITKGEYDPALEYYKRIYQKDTSDVYTILNLGYYSLLTGNFKESLDYYNKYISNQKAAEQIYPIIRRFKESYIGYAFMKNGYNKKADYYFDKTIAENKKLDNSDQADNYSLAQIYALRGDKLMAYKNLEIFSNKAFNAPLQQSIRLKNDPFFISLRNEPRFKKIVQSFEAKYQADHEKIRKWMEAHGEI